MTKDELGNEIGIAPQSQADRTRRRKIEHIEICLQEDVQCKRSSMFECINLIHNALPEIDKNAIDLTTNFFGLRANAPIVIAAMTGGHPDTYEINKRLAEAAESMRIPIGVGSQRAAVENPDLAPTFEVVRENAPSVPVIANIGATHVDLAIEAIDMIEADVLAVHLNPLQESIQPEGDVNSRGFIESIANIMDMTDIPVIVKETGAGISSDAAITLESIGVDGVDVGGVGGTSWAAVEYYRALRDEDRIKAQLGLEFWDWGIPTALSVILVRETTDLDIIATGGIRSGIDVAKALSLGAVAAGVAYPLLRSAVHGTTDDVIRDLNAIKEGLQVAMYLTGCPVVEDLREIPLLLESELLDTLRSMQIDLMRYLRI